MAALSHFPPHFLSLSSHYHPSSSLSFSSQYTSHSNQTHFNGKHSIVCLASSKKSRPSRKLMSDEDLCKSLQDFVALVGLPADHVPSTKQLSEHGRKDLANIVRRRGHKQINDLLANFTKTATDGHDLNGNLYGELIGSNTPDNSGQEEKVIDTCEESVDLIDNDSAVNGSLFTTSESVASSDNVYSSPIESHSLQEKVEKFMRYGLLDAVDDDLCSDLKRIDVEHGKASDHQNISDMVHMRLAGSNDTGLNGTVVLRRPVYSPVIEETSSTFHLSRRQQNTDFEGESAETSKLENELEISRLKHMLHQKELELSRLKDEVEKEKQTLSFLQTKVEDEISNAQKLIAEKEAELLAAEESLSGLLEAKIQYSGEGDLVEVAGSFNGWHQRIKMDPQISSVIIDPINTRKSRLWSTTLWLYPGVYEIKFIVDGQWKIDPNRETTFRGGLENNILRVDR